MSDYTVKLKTVAEELALTPVRLSKDYENIVITVADINRPALQLTGYYDYFNPMRVQIIGMVETTYMETLSQEERRSAFRKLMSYGFPALVVCHECKVLEECLQACEEFDKCLFTSDLNTSDLEGIMLASLRRHMAPRTTLHGVLVEIFGEGVVIEGESGMGKSEVALELIKRGHRLIADDAVEVKMLGPGQLEGSANEMIRYYMELRGIGVINVRHIYGMSAVKPEGNIDMAVYLEPWDDNKVYDRLGLNSETQNILGVEIPKVVIPVRPGRNLASILETAALNNRQKKLGYNAAEYLAAKVDAVAEGKG